MEPKASLVFTNSRKWTLSRASCNKSQFSSPVFLLCFCNRSIHLCIHSSLFLTWRDTFGQDTCLYISTVTLVDRTCKHTTVKKELPTFWLVKKKIGWSKGTIQEGWSTNRYQRYVLIKESNWSKKYVNGYIKWFTYLWVPKKVSVVKVKTGCSAEK
jgi:hypothetical protein